MHAQLVQMLSADKELEKTHHDLGHFGELCGQ